MVSPCGAGLDQPILAQVSTAYVVVTPYGDFREPIVVASTCHAIRFTAQPGNQPRCNAPVIAIRFNMSQEVPDRKFK